MQSVIDFNNIVSTANPWLSEQDAKLASIRTNIILLSWYISVVNAAAVKLISNNLLENSQILKIDEHLFSKRRELEQLIKQAIKEVYFWTDEKTGHAFPHSWTVPASDDKTEPLTSSRRFGLFIGCLLIYFCVSIFFLRDRSTRYMITVAIAVVIAASNISNMVSQSGYCSAPAALNRLKTIYQNSSFDGVQL